MIPTIKQTPHGKIVLEKKQYYDAWQSVTSSLLENYLRKLTKEFYEYRTSFKLNLAKFGRP